MAAASAQAARMSAKARSVCCLDQALGGLASSGLKMDVRIALKRRLAKEPAHGLPLGPLSRPLVSAQAETCLASDRTPPIHPLLFLVCQRLYPETPALPQAQQDGETMASRCFPRPQP